MSQTCVAKGKSKEDPKQDDNLDFCWGRRKENVYYKSFRFDGIEYRVGDSVYMTPSDDGDPHIGMLVKIWETPRDEKMVKLVWFFRPCEITYYLQDVKTLERELFLACGDGEGVFNTSPLEAIAGKCDVVCSSKDRRNCKPTEDLKKADYIFYRTFDVGKCIISDEFPSNIGEIEVGCFFSPSKQSTKDVVAKREETSIARKVRTDSQSTTEANGKQLNGQYRVTREFAGTQSADALRWTNSSLPDVKSANLYDVGARKKRKLHHSLGPRDHGLPGSQARVAKFTNAEDSGIDMKTATVTNKILLHEKKIKSVNREADSRQHVTQRRSYEFFEVPRQTDMVAGKWLKVQYWNEEGLRQAHQKGTLVLFDNLDPSLTFADVEDIVWHVFGQKIQAKMIPLTSYSSQHSGKALTIFKKREAADDVIIKLQNGCLVLGSGRPIFAWRKALKDASSLRGFVGHLAIDRGKAQWRRREIREAVSTSHFSQSNTVEFDLAMQWRALQVNSEKWWTDLNEEHVEKINALSKQIEKNSVAIKKNDCVESKCKEVSSYPTIYAVCDWFFVYA